MGRYKLNFSVLLAVIVAVAAGGGCAPSRSGNVYTTDQAMRVHTVENGTVESVKMVAIEDGDQPVAGAVIGGVAGGVLGSAIGGGDGRKVATVLGSLAGAAAGAATEKEMGRKEALEIVVNKDDGQTIVLVQEADVQISPGDRVRVLTSPDGAVRVSK